jgi:TrwC relaxase
MTSHSRPRSPSAGSPCRPATRPRREVLDAIRVGNDRALDWLEQHAAITRVNGTPVPTTGWAIASFGHMTSRALGTFPHHHNVIANTVEDRTCARRTLDARGLYRHAAQAARASSVPWRSRRHLGDQCGDGW